MDETELTIGIDVGGTNTDAVVLDSADRIRTWTKQPTSDDVTSGMNAALVRVLDELGADAGRVGRVMLGTTHATNAILQRRGLGRVAALRIGAPATTGVPPLATWPADLADAVVVDSSIVAGGYFFDGLPVVPLDLDAVRSFFGSLAGTVDAVAVTGMFSPAIADQELTVAAVARELLGADVPVSLSHEIGSLGLIERENATVLNAALYSAAGEVTGALRTVLAERGIDAAAYFAQNDGTLMALDYATRYPVLTIGSGPANSIRGAAYLSGVADAIIVDVGGTSTDLGVLVNGFPRESALSTEIGGISTNFRMPDILSLAFGGGTVVSGTGQEPRIGPESVGHRITSAAMAFGGNTPTLTDAAVLAGRGRIGAAWPGGWSAPTRTLLSTALSAFDQAIEDAVERVSLGKADRPLIAVGGGAFLVADQVEGASEVLRPERAGVANAVGAAIAQAGGRWEALVPAGAGRDEGIEHSCGTAIRRAVEAGADPRTVKVVEITETPLSYLTQPALRVNVVAAGPLSRL
ncbi:hydantoinase/oxoprolinase N-terminal domain-containing protein [Kribbella solani]|uniref:N-methylhydantoinase A/oxoprolinase/acetone carboxylase beta subunit n=1 Tax=Kribbella solani TaxID=236067 RepID=A0A841DQB9_9ACTN|nr:hydantoinase/oxoprolinase family protein [Kribbella solani]MBB5980049.1 N-methylhydantoinase A/oxoprolinase/acetone carboxylase beta subunit [Kribbella solani]